MNASFLQCRLKSKILVDATKRKSVATDIKTRPGFPTDIQSPLWYFWITVEGTSVVRVDSFLATVYAQGRA